jgi:arylsulfatase A-like enzyme
LIEPGRETIASMLREAGYRTSCVGKWHLGLGSYDPSDPDERTDFSAPLDAGPHTVGFDVSFIFPGSLDMEPYLFVRNGEVVEAATKTTRGGRGRWSGGEGYWRAGPIAPGFTHEGALPRLTEEAVALIRGYGEEPEQPFFLYFPLTAPHTPWVPTEEFRGASEAGWYGDFVAQCDASVGRVLAALEDAGLEDETLVVFSSDNGSHWRPIDVESYAHAANGPWRGMKADIHEAGHRVPMIVRWPARVKAGTTSDALVGLLDWYSTLAEVVGHERSVGEAPDSVSLLAVLQGRSSTSRNELVNHSFDGMFALRSGSWKLIEGRGSGGFTDPANHRPLPGEPLGQLYDLSTDPGETENLYAREPERVIELSKRLDAIRD